MRTHSSRSYFLLPALDSKDGFLTPVFQDLDLFLADIGRGAVDSGRDVALM